MNDFVYDISNAESEEDLKKAISEGLERLGGMIPPEKIYAFHYEQMYDVCDQESWGDPFSYARSREIMMANEFGHTISSTLSGADGYDGEDPVEYKSTISSSINATYNGVSVQSTWDEQVDYLKNEKICKYPRHYYARFEGSKIVEAYQLDGEDVYEILLPKMKKSWEGREGRKDPRLGANITEKEIKKIGKKIK